MQQQQEKNIPKDKPSYLFLSSACPFFHDWLCVSKLRLAWAVVAWKEGENEVMEKGGIFTKKWLSGVV